MALVVTNMTGHLEVKGKLNINRLVLNCKEVKHSLKRVKIRKRDLQDPLQNSLVSKERTSKQLIQEGVQKGFNSVVLTIPTSKKQITALCYPSGKLLFMGATNMSMLEEAVITACVLLKKEIKTPLRVSNVCGSGLISDEPFGPYDLGKLCYFMNFNLATEISARYDRETFDALIINIKQSRQTCTIFKSRKAIVTGTKTTKEMKQVFIKIKSIVSDFNEGKSLFKLN